MPSLQLVIFDCDGVMFDSKDANLHYYNDLLAHFHRPPMEPAELEYVHIHNVFDSIRHIFRHYPEEIDAALAYRARLDYRPYLRHMAMEPDLPLFLDFLETRCHTAISTNRTTTMTEVLSSNGLAHRFEMVVTALDVTHPKPHPEALRRILARFDLPAAAAIYIGDSILDQQHAEAAGVPLIAFRNPRLAAAHHVASFTEIMQLPLCWP
ncbi:MAG: HAD hydrolase-like protein [Thermodesulfobacteriota bacterium]